ncbi:MAG: MATE family efflux transporter [Acetobacteraceae bacterium]
MAIYLFWRLKVTEDTSQQARLWRAQLHRLVLLALPLSFSQLSEIAMGVTDSILLGGLGATALAVGGLTSTLFFCTLITFQSALGAASILIATRRGEAHARRKHLTSLADLVTTGIALGAFLCVPVFLILSPIGKIFSWLGEPEIIVMQGRVFMHILLWGLPPVLVVIGLLRVILPALGSEFLLLWTMPLMALANGFLNATLIYGWFGLSAMGMWGSAIATTVTGWGTAVALVVVSLSRHHLKDHLRLTRVDWPQLWKMLKLGLPMVGASGAELMAFEISGLNAGVLGTESAAAHQVALNIATLSFMVNLALSQAVNIRVSFWLGARDVVAAGRSAMACIGLSMLWSLLAATIIFVFSDDIARFIIDPKTNNAPHVIAMASSLLKISGLFQIVDGLQAACNGILRGCQDTLLPMIFMFITYIPISVFGGRWVAFQGHYGVEGLWWGLAAGLAVLSLLLLIRMGYVLRARRAALGAA